MKKKVWTVKITFTDPQEEDYFSDCDLKECDDIEKIEVI